MQNRYIEYKVIVDRFEKKKHYEMCNVIVYYSSRYKKAKTVPMSYKSDGATGALDIASLAWWVHDRFCQTCVWDDGTPLTNWQASRVLSDILAEEKRYLRSFSWLIATFLLGCSMCRKNGLLKRKHK